MGYGFSPQIQAKAIAIRDGRHAAVIGLHAFEYFLSFFGLLRILDKRE
jgi:hypothetical protein